MSVDHAETAERLRVDQPWRADAACVGRSEVMDPPAETVKSHRDLGIESLLWRKAKKVCWACPVYDQCQAWVLSLPKAEDVTGVCGGLTEAERQKARRRQAGLKSAATIRELAAVDEPVPDGMLRCSRCHAVKPDDGFVRDKRNTGRRGRASWCRVCESKWRRDRSGRRP